MGIESLEPFTEKRWYHLTVTYDASMSARGLRLFIDGEPVACRITQNNDSNPGAVSVSPFESESVPWLSTSSECWTNCSSLIES